MPYLRWIYETSIDAISSGFIKNKIDTYLLKLLLIATYYDEHT